MAMPLTNQDTVVREHNAFMKGKAEGLIPIIEQALRVIEAEYNLLVPVSGTV